MATVVPRRKAAPISPSSSMTHTFREGGHRRSGWRRPPRFRDQAAEYQRRSLREAYWKRSTDTYKLEAYRSDGTFPWRYDLGWAIECGIWYSPYVVFDFDGDGRAEVAVKTGEGDLRDPDGRVTSGPDTSPFWMGGGLGANPGRVATRARASRTTITRAATSSESPIWMAKHHASSWSAAPTTRDQSGRL